MNKTSEMDKKKPEDLESKIIEIARELFIENGFAETSMSDIAAKAGINRPTLHYYFRTKDRMFRAVFGSIVTNLIPQVQGILQQQDMPLTERVGHIIDIYFKTFMINPSLPMFLMREMHRDYNFVADFVKSMHFDKYFENIRETLQREMNNGKIKPVPMRFIFLSFYSMLIAPFTAKPLCTNALLNEGESYSEFLTAWKPYIVNNISLLLEPEQ